MKRNRFLIVGTGFIAENFIRHLSNFPNFNKDTTVYVLFNEHKLNLIAENIVQHKLTNQNIKLILKKFNPNYILCLLGNSFVASNDSLRQSIEMNAIKIMEFLDVLSHSAAKDKLEKILVIGSASEYGKFYDAPIKETFPLHATSLYGLGKICLYNASVFYHERGLPIVHIRQFNTTGPLQRETFVLPSFCKQVAEIEKGIRRPTIFVGDLSQERDFVDIRDTCRAYSLLFEKGNNGEVYNVASGNCISIHKLLNTLLQLIGPQINIEIKEQKDLFIADDSLSKRLHADISKIKKLGFKLNYRTADTIKDTLDFWRNNV